ncbi:BamA/TamA family outer membrane protein [Myxococcota bacterium]|nr:BamA/TamA family outer membrane protein [Myxococcota bacterium]
MLLLWLLATLALAADTSWYAVPNVAYDSDDGLGFGARFEHARLDPALSPYRRAWMVHSFASMRGYQHHRVRFDRLGLGRDGRTRLTVNLSYRQWANDGYWGIGNGTLREQAFVEDADGGALDADDPARKRYRYQLLQPFAQVALRRQVTAGGPLYAYLALNPKYSVVKTYEGSLLAEQRPYGMDGGFVPQLLFGIQHDTRSPEVCPSEGALLELGGRLAPWGTGQAGGFGGLFLSARGFQALGTPRLVLAGRLMAEAMWGSVPFYEMVHWGGATPVQGVGGFETLRGISFGRWRAPGKAVANAELRARVLDGDAGQVHLGLELAPYVDAGAVFFAGDQATAATPANPIHPAAGVGTRLVLDETFVGRVDLGWGVDPVQTDQGVESRKTMGIYVVFDHPF